MFEHSLCCSWLFAHLFKLFKLIFINLLIGELFSFHLRSRIVLRGRIGVNLLRPLQNCGRKAGRAQLTLPQHHSLRISQHRRIPTIVLHKADFLVLSERAICDERGLLDVVV